MQQYHRSSPRVSYSESRKKRHLLLLILVVPLLFLCLIKLHYYLHPLHVTYLMSDKLTRELNSVKDVTTVPTIIMDDDDDEEDEVSDSVTTEDSYSGKQSSGFAVI